MIKQTFSKPGTSHVHIDGSQDYELVTKLVSQMETRGNPGKFNHVYDFIAGQQRKILPETYQSHTPALDGKEALDFFSTTLVRDRNDAIRLVNLIMKSLAHIPGIIIELEQVRGLYDYDSWQEIDASQRMKPITKKEIRYAPGPSLPIEIHHQFDIPKHGVAPISLYKLLKHCEVHGIVVGGWFVFEKEHHWAYRSNSFVDEKSYKKIVEREYWALDAYLKTQGYTLQKFRTLAEGVVGIWQT